jgi:beta-galactosamide-alpha-2,3-sialyltransferase
LRFVANEAFFHFVENRLLSFIKFVKKFDLIKYDYMYFSSFHDVYCKYIYSKNSEASIYTFDDGFGNLNKEGVLYKDSNMSYRKKVMYRLFGIKKNISDFRKNSLKHYTIYNNKSNIIENTTHIKIFKDTGDFNINKDEVVVFFVGQPLNVLDKKYDSDKVNKIIGSLNIDYYFAHPFENYEIQDIETIQTDLIFEDFILHYMLQNPNYNVCVMGFFSTALLNLCSVKDLDVQYIINKELEEDFSNAYNLIKTFDIKFINVPAS